MRRARPETDAHRAWQEESNDSSVCCWPKRRQEVILHDNVQLADRRPAGAPRHRPRGRPPFERIALLLQGGGALGAYQGGVYEGLAEAGLHPDWTAGISIGAINAAIIAGNPPEARVEKLRQFWELVTTPNPQWPFSNTSTGRLTPNDERRHIATLPPRTRAAGISRRFPVAAHRQCRPHSAQPVERGPRPVRGRSRLLRAAPADTLAVAERHNRGDQLLRYPPAQSDVGAARRFRSHQQRGHALQRRRRQRPHRQLRLFQLHNSPNPPGACDGQRRAAARISGYRDRRRALLGRRPDLEYAAELGG